MEATVNQANSTAPQGGVPLGNVMDGGEKAPIKLIDFRKDLDMYPGTPSLEGYPTYVIHDRYSHRFFNLGHTEYEIIKRWHLGSVEAIVEDIYETTTLYVNEEDVEFLNDYLLRNNFAIVNTREQIDEIFNKEEPKKSFNPMKLFGMLMINTRLARPDRYLTNTYWMFKFAFTKGFWWFMGVLAAISLFLVIRDFSAFKVQAYNIFTVTGLTAVVFALPVSKLFHEFGHAFMCKHLGLAVPKFGLRIMIILPFFYTDTNESWKLHSRKDRFMIGAAGILSELILAIFAMFLWGILDDGLARNVCFYLFVTSLLSTFAINLTPFLKWDGYYMFSDILGIPNLQKRGFDLGKWQLREWLFKWDVEIPTKFSPTMHKIVIFYAYGAWIKRVFIFLAIGVLIYQRLFKVLGIMLLSMQVYAFILKPVITEVAHWIKNFDKMNFNKHSVTTLLIFAFLLAMVFVPWQTTITMPATITPRVQAILYTPESAQVLSVHTEKNQQVKKGETLVQLKNINLEYQIRLAKSNVDIIQNSLNRYGDQNTRESRAVLQNQLKAETQRTTGLIGTFKDLKIVAPFDGEIVQFDETLKPGSWFRNNSPLITLMDKSTLEIYAYVPEKDLIRINKDGEAIFYPENPRIPPVNGWIIDIDKSETKVLKHKILSSEAGGKIAAKQDATEGLIPEKTFYRIRLGLAPEDTNNLALDLRGTLHLDGEKQSIAYGIFRKAVSVLIRESGF